MKRYRSNKKLGGVKMGMHQNVFVEYDRKNKRNKVLQERNEKLKDKAIILEDDILNLRIYLNTLSIDELIGKDTLWL